MMVLLCFDALDGLLHLLIFFSSRNTLFPLQRTTSCHLWFSSGKERISHLWSTISRKMTTISAEASGKIADALKEKGSIVENLKPAEDIFALLLSLQDNDGCRLLGVDTAISVAVKLVVDHDCPNPRKLANKIRNDPTLSHEAIGMDQYDCSLMKYSILQKFPTTTGLHQSSSPSSSSSSSSSSSRQPQTDGLPNESMVSSLGKRASDGETKIPAPLLTLRPLLIY